MGTVLVVGALLAVYLVPAAVSEEKQLQGGVCAPARFCRLDCAWTTNPLRSTTTTPSWGRRRLVSWSQAQRPDKGTNPTPGSKLDGPTSRAEFMGEKGSRLLVGMSLVLTRMMAFGSPARAVFLPNDQIKGDYDRYSSTYDALDGGPLASWLGLERARGEVALKAQGRVLEVAVGTGLNLPYYQQARTSSRGVTSIDAIDISPGMLREARIKAEALGLNEVVTFKEMDVGSLSYPDSTFDTVVDTFSLCVFPDPSRALSEMARVVKPGGKVLLAENNRSDFGPLGAYQDLTGSLLASRGGKGCVWNQDVRSLVEGVGLRVERQVSLVGGLFTLVEAVKGSSP